MIQQAEIAFETRHQRSSIRAFAADGAWQPLLIALALVFFLNFSGIHVLLAYSTTGWSNRIHARSQTIRYSALKLSLFHEW